MQFTSSAFIAALTFTLIAAPTAARAPTSTATLSPAQLSPTPLTFDLQPEKYVLDNGLEVIVLEDHTLPLVSVNLWYHVGPANEPVGRSGFAHLFEHLMFEGSEHQRVGFDVLMESIGATNVNGTTNWDRTNYFETVPSEHLELMLWLESDRMGFLPAVLTQERLDIQRGVVKNERRQSFENSPYGPSELTLYDTLFPLGHPYHGAVIGSMADLDRATLADVRAFFAAYYSASNATLTLVGDVDPVRARSWVDRYFGPLEKRNRPERKPFSTPALRAAQRIVVTEPVQLARVAMAWIAPPAFSADDAALDLATSLIAGGRATRLYQELVVKQQLATEASAALDANEAASVVTLDAVVKHGVEPAKVERAMAEVIARLAKDGPNDAELARARRSIELNVASSLQLLNSHGGDGGRAGILQRLNHYLGKPDALAAEMAKLAAVTKEDVRRVIATYLRADARLTVVTLPQDAAPPEGTASPQATPAQAAGAKK